MSGDKIFNNPVESALRSLVLLVEAYPATLDLQRLVYLDYLLVHSADADGPSSLHPATPQRDGEVAVRRGLIEQGLHLLLVRGLAVRRATQRGFEYAASEIAGSLITSLEADYSKELVARARWVTSAFAQYDLNSLGRFFSERIGRWDEEFALTFSEWEGQAE